MTARTCPVHGEYSATGVCRWCEPLSAPDVSPLPWVERQILVDWSTFAPSDSALQAWMTPLGSTLRRYSTPEGVASHAAFWESKLAAQHAALRWERVARRWTAKRPPLKTIYEGHKMDPVGGLAFDDHCASCVRLAREGRWP